MLDQNLLLDATNEAIYWWKRDEFFYHKVFENVKEIIQDQKQKEFFTNYLFKTFAKQYSVHRTIKDFNKNAIGLLEFLNTQNYFNHVINHDTDIIDNIASKLDGRFANGKPVSFLSKLAFLINPKSFSLYDKYARNSINLILKSKVTGKEKAIDKTYKQFILKVNNELDENERVLLSQLIVLNKFSSKMEINFLEMNPKIFVRRIFDKYLWLYSQDELERRSSLDIETHNMIWNYYES